MSSREGGGAPNGNPERTGASAAQPRFRRPTEADYPAVAAVIDDWWDGRVVRGLLPRLWFRHFTGMSWLAEIDEPAPPPAPGPDAMRTRTRTRIVGFLVGYLAPNDPRLAICQAIGVHPSHRRRGIGRALLDRFFEDARPAGAQRVESVSWPGDRRSVQFHLALGFRPEGGPETRPVFGLPAHEGYDFGIEDRVRFVREL